MTDPDLRHSPDPRHTQVLRAVGTWGLVVALLVGVVGAVVGFGGDFFVWCAMAGGVLFFGTALADVILDERDDRRREMW